MRWELECHLQDHAEALEAAGHPPEQAQARALAAMGDPQEVGSALDREFPWAGSSSPGVPLSWC